VPLSLLTAQCVTSPDDLMDAGYDAEQIREQSVNLGHIPILPRRKLGSEGIEILVGFPARWDGAWASKTRNG